jgi:hypothetical protein
MLMPAKFATKVCFPSKEEYKKYKRISDKYKISFSQLVRDALHDLYDPKKK